MEDENGLDLHLGLSCGKSTAVSRAANGSSSDTRIEEADRGSKIINDFKHFLDGGNQKQEPGLVSQRSDLAKPEENFFDNISTSANVDASANLSTGAFWVVNSNRSPEVEEENRLEMCSKRKGLFEVRNDQKKRGRDSEKTRASHISITTDEGSTAENEDVADSEAEGSTSRLVPHCDDGSGKHTGVGGFSDTPNDVHGVSGPSCLEKGQNRFTISSDNEFKFRNVSYGTPLPSQSVNMVSVPYTLPVKESNPIVAPGTSNYALPGMMHMIATSNGERPANQHVMPANLPLMFGYSPVQIPVLDKDNSQDMVPHSQHLHLSHFNRVPPDSEKQTDGVKTSEVPVPLTLHKSSETSKYDGTVLELTKGDKKHQAAEGGSSSQTGDGVKQSSINVNSNTSDQPRHEGFPSEFQAIRPGIEGNVKFGGCGSVPNLPWVSTTGSGPKGRTISGVTYRVGATQIRIVCACHGMHMSPEEFVRHASEDQQTYQEVASGLAFPSNNTAASAQS